MPNDKELKAIAEEMRLEVEGPPFAGLGLDLLGKWILQLADRIYPDLLEKPRLWSGPAGSEFPPQWARGRPGYVWTEYVPGEKVRAALSKIIDLNGFVEPGTGNETYDIAKDALKDIK